MLRIKPTYIVGHVTDINLEDLKKDSIKGLVFDLDNTIMPPKTGDYPEDILKWLEMVKNEFKIAILSNNPHKEYVQKAGEKAGCIAYEKAQKPRIKAAVQALKDLDLLPEQVVIIGDRPLTDILVGQRLGLTTVLVDPLITHDENQFISFLKMLERCFISSALKKFADNGNNNQNN